MINNIMGYLEKYYREQPKKEAFIDEHSTWTVEKMRMYSRNVAKHLVQKQIMHEPVAVYMEKSNDTLCAFFGAAYSGNFYSLYNPDLTDYRLEQIQSVLSARIILTTSDLFEHACSLFEGADICLINEWKETADLPDDILDSVMDQCVDVDPLYINFTSGSTGVPKGVMISHQSVIEFIDVFTETFKMEANARIANQAPFDFDVSVKDIYAALKTQASLIIVPKRLFSAPAELMDYLCDHSITTLIWAVSALSLVCVFHALDYKVPATIHTVMFSGEVMPLKHLKAWQKALPNARFVNLYGPTEITCNCTYHVIDASRDYSEGIPIGSVFKNEHVFLLDETDHLIDKPGVIGEICIKGRSVGIGYYNNPEQTQQHFVQNPVQKMYYERIYRSGDLGSYNDRGELMFEGRKDFQIKYQGHRIELEEIEKQALGIDEVMQCCAAFDAQKKRLYCFYAGDIEKALFVEKLKVVLPAYMIPRAIYKLESLPLTKNGKTDRKTLLQSAKEGAYRGR